MRVLLLLIACLAAQAAAAPAATVWRCGAQGRSYGDAPCRDGRPLDPSDPRSAEQTAQARQVAAADRRLADVLTRERRARDASSLGPVLYGIKPAAVEPPHKAPPKQARAKHRRGPVPRSAPDAGDETWRAVARASR